VTVAKKATIKDIAEATDLSIATVSLVLNNKGQNIPEKTCRRIKAVAEQLNYLPDYNARSLVTGKSRTVGVIIPDISNMFFAEMVRHIQLELDTKGYDIILCNSEEKMQNDIKYINLLASRRVDGLILTMSAESMYECNRAAIEETLERLTIPYIFLDRYFKKDSNKVMVDNEESGWQVATHLLSLGHRKLGVITGPDSLNSSSNRLKGFLGALDAHGVSIGDDCIVHGTYDLESGQCGAEILINKGVTAIFAFNDLQAYGVVMTANKLGYSVPRDLSVVGFDDSLYSSISETKLTTVHQPLKELAKAVCDMLENLLSGKETPKEVKLKAQLIVRDSVRNLNV